MKCTSKSYSFRTKETQRGRTSSPYDTTLASILFLKSYPQLCAKKHNTLFPQLVSPAFPPQSYPKLLIHLGSALKLPSYFLDLGLVLGCFIGQHENLFPDLPVSNHLPMVVNIRTTTLCIGLDPLKNNHNKNICFNLRVNVIIGGAQVRVKVGLIR